MVKELKYPDGFIKPNAVKLDDENIQRLVDEVMKNEELEEKATGDTLVRRLVEDKGVYEVVEVYRLDSRSGNIVER